MKYQLVLLAALLLIYGVAPAQETARNHVLFGMTLLTPYTTGSVDGPKMVVDETPGVVPYVARDWYSSIAVVGLSTGVFVYHLNISFVATYLGWVIVSGPYPQNGSELILEARYILWQYGRSEFSAVVSLKRGRYGQTGGMFNSAYEFTQYKWLPGIGMDAKYSVIHAQIQLRGWPRTVIAYAHEPNGLPPNAYDQAAFDLKPVYLNYAVSFTLGLEFEVFDF